MSNEVLPSATARPVTPCPPPLRHRGETILVLGILSLLISWMAGCVCCFGPMLSLVLGIVAWSMGRGDIRLMDAGRMDSAGRGMTDAGRICGIIGVALSLVEIVVGLLWIAFYGVIVLLGLIASCAQ